MFMLSTVRSNLATLGVIRAMRKEQDKDKEVNK